MTRKTLGRRHHALHALLLRHQGVRQALQLRQHMQVSDLQRLMTLEAIASAPAVTKLTHCAQVTRDHADAAERHGLPRRLVAHHALDGSGRHSLLFFFGCLRNDDFGTAWSDDGASIGLHERRLRCFWLTRHDGHCGRWRRRGEEKEVVGRHMFQRLEHHHGHRRRNCCVERTCCPEVHPPSPPPL